MDGDSQSHHLTHPLYARNRGWWKVGVFYFGLKITISVDFLVFKVRLLVSGQLAIDSSLDSMVHQLEADTTIGMTCHRHI